MIDFRILRSITLTTIAVLSVLVGVAVRVVSAFNDLWLDEIWSLNLVSQIAAPAEILTKLRIDNNHLLNSLGLFILGPNQDFLYYRLPALVCGLFSIPLFVALTQRHGRMGAAIGSIVFALSYPAALYSSEARGYGPAVFFTLLAIWSLEQTASKLPSLKRFGWFVVLNLSLVLGLLSHYSFTIAITALALYSLVAPGEVAKYIRLIAGFLLPACVAFFIYFAHYRYLPAGSGGQEPYLQTIINSLAISFGAPLLTADEPQIGAFILLGAIILILCALSESYSLWRERNPRWALYLVGALVLPILTLTILQPRVLYLRYLLISLVFFYLLITSFLVRLASRTRVGGILVTLLLLAYTVGQFSYLFDLAKYGRGNYQTALYTLLQLEPKETVVIGGNHEFRDRMILSFYWGRCSTAKELVYLPKKEWAESSPDWLLLQTQEPNPIVEPNITTEDESLYSLVETFPSGPLSGWHWSLYERENRLLELPR